MNVANYTRKYAKTSSNKVVIIKKDNINSTHKWVEYALDIVCLLYTSDAADD